jgi:redox-sensing transcriptional repressor
MEDDIARAGCNIGVIAVPAPAAQAIAHRMAAAGIRAILNFAPTALHLRAPVLVRNIDLAGELSMLTHWLTAADAEAEAHA